MYIPTENVTHLNIYSLPGFYRNKGSTIKPIRVSLKYSPNK